MPFWSRLEGRSDHPCNEKAPRSAVTTVIRELSTHHYNTGYFYERRGKLKGPKWPSMHSTTCNDIRTSWSKSIRSWSSVTTKLGFLFLHSPLWHYNVKEPVFRYRFIMKHLNCCRQNSYKKFLLVHQNNQTGTLLLKHGYTVSLFRHYPFNLRPQHKIRNSAHTVFNVSSRFGLWCELLGVYRCNMHFQ